MPFLGHDDRSDQADTLKSKHTLLHSFQPIQSNSLCRPILLSHPNKAMMLAFLVWHIQFFNHSYHLRFKLIQNTQNKMENKETFEAQLAQSEQEFRRQFDPTSGMHHGGIQVPVPLNGARIPESMPTIHPEGFDPTKPQEVIDYGEEYKAVESNRNVYQNLKKELAKLGPIVEAFLRHEEHFKLKADPNNESHRQVHQANLAKQTVNLNAIQSLLSAFIPTLQAMDADGKECAKELSDIIFESNKKHQNKEVLTDFNFRVKKLSTRTFSIAQKCLQRLKDIKKEYANKQKAAEKKEETTA